MSTEPGELTLFLCGDVMTGRGIDQVLGCPSDPAIFEPSATSARQYVWLAEQVHGKIPRPVDDAYIWGDFLGEAAARRPHARIINLETAVTTSARATPKGINYRMHPGNIGCLTAAGIDCCTLANNHVLDWDESGLVETVDTLQRAGIATTGAGRDPEEAARPAILLHPQGRLLVFGYGCPCSGVAVATDLNALAHASGKTAGAVVNQIRQYRRPGDLVVVSIHWGGNWGYRVSPDHRAFAQGLVDSGTVDVVHGHSSHHARGVEVYRGKLILYGCGDFINDYEGITGYEPFRPDLVLAYFVRLAPQCGDLASLEMVPFKSRRFRLERVRGDDASWLAAMFTREGEPLETRAALTEDEALSLEW